MSETLSVRIPADDKRLLRELAALQGKSVNAFVRDLIREQLDAAGGSPGSPLSRFFGSVDVAVPAPTNDAVRRRMRESGQ
jgi:hypothetical protein